jgi:ATP-dependent Clp protease adaptor protein ClpS
MGARHGDSHFDGPWPPGTARNGRLRKMNDDDRHEWRGYPAHRSMANPPGDGGRGNDGRTDGGGEGPNTGVVVKARPKTRKPAMYKVLMLNDDYTPMEFVVHVLERFFQKTREEATRIMLHVHRRGVGVCGVFTYEVAETKVTQVMDLARQNQHPLQCTIEKE